MKVIYDTNSLIILRQPKSTFKLMHPALDTMLLVTKKLVMYSKAEYTKYNNFYCYRNQQTNRTNRQTAQII